jgi:hypothetical protein
VLLTQRVLPLVCLSAVLASAQYNPEISFCSAGVQADGFVDWSKLPKAPPLSFPSQAPAITATIPVTGVPGLNAEVQIASSYPTSPDMPYYVARNSADLATNINNGTPLTITFSQPVKGVSVVLRAYGRSGHNFIMTANDVNGNTRSTGAPPPPAQVTSNGWDYATQQVVTAPLQIVSTDANLKTITFGFFGNDTEYGSFELINLRVQSGSGPDPSKAVPTNGLTEWFRADKVTADEAKLPYYPGNITTWPDQSGNGNDASASGSNSPAYTLDGPNCTPVLSFNGSQALHFTQPINGWNAMTVIIAAQAYGEGVWSGNAALFWDQTGRWGQTYIGPSQGDTWFRFGTGQVDNQPEYHHPIFQGGDFSVTTATHNGNTDSLYVNGILALRQAGKFAQLANNAPTALIGGGYQNSFFTGNIGEILIYDRVLSNTERERVEQYLMAKYGVH